MSASVQFGNNLPPELQAVERRLLEAASAHLADDLWDALNFGSDRVVMNLFVLSHGRLGISAVYWSQTEQEARERAIADDPCWKEEAVSASSVVSINVAAQDAIEMQHRMFFGRRVTPLGAFAANLGLREGDVIPEEYREKFKRLADESMPIEERIANREGQIAIWINSWKKAEMRADRAEKDLALCRGMLDRVTARWTEPDDKRSLAMGRAINATISGWKPVV